ncbi:hypothetical protein AVEN_155958-1 [Araneus ventricosus]|uniref:Uncharacterized protein n=1 Tax=Araneus ventricosus TaxID=182803 RepID=A0A4Y2GV63_ARAVE|nr:hypothetical protein AVEN_155958-1 [Araneus ventricosus]
MCVSRRWNRLYWTDLEKLLPHALERLQQTLVYVTLRCGVLYMRKACSDSACKEFSAYPLITTHEFHVPDEDLEGIFNTQNKHAWAESNPYFIVYSKYQEIFSINVWAGILPLPVARTFVRPSLPGLPGASASQCIAACSAHHTDSPVVHA